jgi:hypothetical protein
MELKSIVPWGRSFEEYKKMFSLSDADLKKKILGCGDGPASFNAELTALGGNVISIDPVYQFDASSLKARIDEAYNEVMPQAHTNKDKYIWESSIWRCALTFCSSTVNMSVWTSILRLLKSCVVWR